MGIKRTLPPIEKDTIDPDQLHICQCRQRNCIIAVQLAQMLRSTIRCCKASGQEEMALHLSQGLSGSLKATELGPIEPQDKCDHLRALYDARMDDLHEAREAARALWTEVRSPKLDNPLLEKILKRCPWIEE